MVGSTEVAGSAGPGLAEPPDVAGPIGPGPAEPPDVAGLTAPPESAG
jgi:hypothetical protein